MSLESRPISVLTVVSKIVERNVHGLLYDILNDLNLSTACQSGFRKCQSMATALVKIYNDFLKWVDNGNFVRIVFIDLRRAFDTVDNGILFKKLVAYGAEGRELEWFKSYLSNRFQQVNFERTLSDEQGSILGPLLFIICMNDALQRGLPKVFH